MMRRGLATIAVLICSAGILIGQTFPIGHRVQLQVSDEILIRSVRTDEVLRYVYCAGSFSGSLTVQETSIESRGLIDGFVACFNDQLDLLWLQQIGGPGRDEITCLDVIPGDGIVFGAAAGGGLSTFTTYTIGDVTFGGNGNADVATGRFSPTGDVVWARNDGDFGFEVPIDVRVLPNGSTVIVGTFGQDSRFGGILVSSGGAREAGFLQCLDNTGNHSWVITSSSAKDGALFEQISNVSDSGFTFQVMGPGSVQVGDNELDLEMYAPVQMFCTPDGRTQPDVQWQHCNGPQLLTNGGRQYEGTSYTSSLCQDPVTDWYTTWHSAFPGRSDTILREYRSNRGNLRQFFPSSTRSGNRMVIAGAFIDSLDLTQTSTFPDAVADDGTEYQPFLALSTALGRFQTLLTIRVSERAEALHPAFLGNQIAFVLFGRGTVIDTDPQDQLSPQAPWLVLGGEHFVSVQETDSHTRHPEPRSGEGPLFGFGSGEGPLFGFGSDEGPLFVYDVAGTLLTTLSPSHPSSTLSSTLISSLSPGVYVLRQGTRVSLCHVYGPHHIAFALPAGSPR